ncbi:MAG TPA: DUF5666 domain-containing protein [Candidatus Limnocylindrales bacterium]|nr:DUF5666 domain-containing protein [Candidatus Limnocylindrales bacterium]
MAAPTGQAAPFDPSTMPIRPVRPKPSTRRFVVPIVGALVLLVAGFGVGYAAANLTATPARDTALNGNGGFGGGNFGPGSSFRPRNGFANGASGTIGSVSASQMTITTATGGSRIVLLTPSTTVDQVSSSTKALSDLTSGETVTVVGTTNPDGSVTATRVIIGDVGVLGGRGFFGGAGASATP